MEGQAAPHQVEKQLKMRPLLVLVEVALDSEADLMRVLLVLLGRLAGSFGLLLDGATEEAAAPAGGPDGGDGGIAESLNWVHGGEANPQTLKNPHVSGGVSQAVVLTTLLRSGLRCFTKIVSIATPNACLCLRFACDRILRFIWALQHVNVLEAHAIERLVVPSQPAVTPRPAAMELAPS